MKRKITRFALGARCGSFGASGSVLAARALPAPRPANARAPNPQALSCRKRRRLISSTLRSPLVDIAEVGRREERVKDRGPGLLRLRRCAQVAERDPGLSFAGKPAQGEAPGPREPGAVVLV